MFVMFCYYNNVYKKEGVRNGSIMKKVVVTGGAGFIGSNLALELERRGEEVVVFDDFSSGKRGNLDGFGGEVVKADVSSDSFTRLKGLDEVKVIFHEAAITDPRHPDDSEVRVKNIFGFENVLELAKRNACPLIYASSASLYGNTAAPQREDQVKDIMSAYAQSKLMMDEMASHNFSDMQIVGLRYFNVFGPREAGKGRPASMIYHLYNQIKAEGKARIFEFGEQSRDHIYVKDVVEATIAASSWGVASGVYNVGTGVGTRFDNLVSAIEIVLGRDDVEIEYIKNPYRGSYQDETEADTTRAKRWLGFEAKWSLKEGIKDYVEWLDGERKTI